jgi:hypothetical protein
MPTTNYLVTLSNSSLELPLFLVRIVHEKPKIKIACQMENIARSNHPTSHFKTTNSPMSLLLEDLTKLIDIMIMSGMEKQY